MRTPVTRAVLVVTAFVVGSLGVARVRTQAPPSPVFDAASVKVNRSGSGASSMRLSAGRVTMENVTLKKVMLTAYGIPEDREYALTGPDWLTTEHFNIQATFPADASVQQATQMLQALLAERFRVTMHRENRQLPIYMMVVAKDGLRIHPAEDGEARTLSGPGRLEAAKITMPKLADLLARMTERQVLDQTGVKGVFDFTLTWSPSDPAATNPDGPSLFTALEEQLGLKLNAARGAVDVLVIDHVERPSED